MSLGLIPSSRARYLQDLQKMLLGNALMIQFGFLLLLVAFAFKIPPIHAQVKDFISIDCGAAADYVDTTTGIPYVSDSAFVQTGVTNEISASYKTNSLEQQFHTVRSFPEGKKNCYTLTPRLVDGSDYLVRAHFMYGNYDQKNQVPQFDLYVGVNLWTSVKFVEESTVITKEIINVPSSNLSYVCIVNTGLGTPFISVLELRILNSSVYPSDYGSLELLYRLDAGSQFNQYRYPYDFYDRIWKPWNLDPTVEYISTSETIDKDPSNSIDFPAPSVVMSTAVTPRTPYVSIDFYWKPENPTDQYYLYFYFADFQQNQIVEYREFMIYLNDETWYHDSEVPLYLYTNRIISTKPVSRDRYKVSIRPTSNSILLPILNAFEAYTVRTLTLVGTNQGDVDALKSISTTYEVKKINWQGDPCVPQSFSWEGVNCSKPAYDNPRITALNLSSSGLAGKISPSISELTSLESLDMSNNGLTGPVPDFFSQMTSLRYLNLSGNKLTGNVPSELLKRQNTILTLSLENNPGLCTSDKCKKSNGKHTTLIVIVVVALVLGVLIVIAILAANIWRRIKKRKQADIVSKPGEAVDN